MAEIMGIINLTPDSFSDGGKFADARMALDAISEMIGQGACAIDIGAESTRPGAVPVSPEEEWQRLEPVLSSLHRIKKGGAAFSLDTRHGESAKRALDLGIDWINDVTGFSSPEMVAAVKASECKLVMMHSLGVPADKKITLASRNVVETLTSWAKQRLVQLEMHGIARERILFDPGVGFGKTARQSLSIIRNVKQFSALGVPVLVGHSRKSFLADLSADRDDATLAASLYIASQGVDWLRVHDVARHAQMLTVWNTIAHDRESRHKHSA